jgi:hypothetical protein
MMVATGWQAHSVRGAMSGSIKKALGIEVTSGKTEASTDPACYFPCGSLFRRFNSLFDAI